MKIKNIEIQGHVILGPMAGVTTLAYRDFMKPFGVGLSYSEMISDCGIDYGNSRTFEYLQTSKLDRPVGLQLFGFSAQNAVKAIEIIEKCADFDILDINSEAFLSYFLPLEIIISAFSFKRLYRLRYSLPFAIFLALYLSARF